MIQKIPYNGLTFRIFWECSDEETTRLRQRDGGRFGPSPYARAPEDSPLSAVTSR